MVRYETSKILKTSPTSKRPTTAYQGPLFKIFGFHRKHSITITLAEDELVYKDVQFGTLPSTWTPPKSKIRFI